MLGIPGFLKRRSTTAVNVRAGETIVIAGLVSRLRANDSQQLPTLGAMPGLGALFRSRSERRQSSELVIFITPRTVESLPSGNPDASDDNRRRIDEAREQMRSIGAGDPQPGRTR